MIKPALLKSIFPFCIYLCFTNTIILAEAGEILWKFKAQDQIYSSPAIGNDNNIYFSCLDSYVYAVNPDGIQKWKFKMGAGTASSPTIDNDGTIYIGSHDYNIYAINPNGTLKWKYKTDKYINVSPTIGKDGTIYFSSWDGNFYALNKDGTIKWKYYIGIENPHSAAAIDKSGFIYFGAWDNYIYSITSDGTLKWKYKTGDKISSSPAIGIEGTIYIGSNDKYLYAINPNGTLKWKYNLKYPVGYSSPVIDNNGIIYIGNNNKTLLALHPDGTLKWEFLSVVDTNTTPLIGRDGTIYVNSCAINNDGTIKWKLDKRLKIMSSSLTLNENGLLFIGSTDYNLYAIDSGFHYGLAYGNWPKYCGDLKNTGNIQDLVINPGLIDIGGVSLENVGEGNFTIKNHDYYEVSIDSIYIDNEFFTLNYPSSSIQPGDSLNVQVIYIPKLLGEQVAKIKVILENSNFYYIIVRGEGKEEKPEIVVDQDNINFGYVPINKFVFQTITIKNEGLKELIVSKINIDNPLFTVEPTSLVIPPGKSDTIKITYKPTEIVFSFANITITCNDPHNEIISISVEGNGFAESEIQYFVKIDNPTIGNVEVNGYYTFNEKNNDYCDFSIKNFNILNIEFYDEQGNILEYDNWEYSYENFFRVYNNSKYINFKYSLKLLYIVQFEEYPPHATLKDSYLDENIGIANSGKHFLLFSTNTIDTDVNINFILPEKWIALSNLNHYGNYLSYYDNKLESVVS